MNSQRNEFCSNILRFVMVYILVLLFVSVCDIVIYDCVVTAGGREGEWVVDHNFLLIAVIILIIILLHILIS